MANWAYMRLDRKYFATALNPITFDAALKAYCDYFVNQQRISASNIIVENTIYHTRQKLTNLLGQRLLIRDSNLEDPSMPSGPAQARPGDVLMVYNLSHLSREPAIIGRLVETIVNKAQMDFVTVSSKIDTTDRNARQHYLNAFAEWAKIATHTAVHNGGGDGGGDGGC